MIEITNTDIFTIIAVTFCLYTEKTIETVKK